MRFLLLRRCIEYDSGDAWAELFHLVKDVAAPMVAGLLRRFGLGLIETESVLTEFMLSLWHGARPDPTRHRMA